MDENLVLYKFLRLKHRYIFTRDNRLRLRYVAGLVVVASVAVTGSVGSSVAYSPARYEVAHNDSLPYADGVRDRAINAVAELSAVLGSHDSFSDRETEDVAFNPSAPDVQIIGVEGLEEVEAASVADVFEQADVQPLQYPRDEILKIGTGDTIAGVLQKSGVGGADAYKAVKALGQYYDPRNVKPGQAISVTFDSFDGDVYLSAMDLKLSAIEAVRVSRDDKGRYTAQKDQKEVVQEMVAAKAAIETSLYGSAARAGIPASIVAEMIRIFSYEVDFQRDIRQGDGVEILYETYETEDGDFARYGDVLYAKLNVGGEDISVYRYEGKNGESGYYKENGRTLKRTLMMTPVDGARVSSGYGMRRHPVLGYNKMHKGVDFAAPTGTPIYAAGDGVVEKASRFGSYGHYIRIRHDNALKTAYAHLHGYAKGIKPGKRVKQGQTIGYVGNTGRSTGPHLHFEVMKNGKHVNPKSIKSSAGAKLTGAKLKSFKAQMSRIQSDYASLSKDLKFASRHSR